MRQIAKFVAGLLVVLIAMPVLAMTPCHRTVRSIKCCVSECPRMMSKSAEVTAILHSGPGFSRPACCSVSSRYAAPLAVRVTTDRRSDLEIPHNLPAVVFLEAEHSFGLPSLHKGPPLLPASRAVLCSFLI